MEIRAIQQKAKSQVLNSESDFVCCFCLPRMFEEISLRPWKLTRSLSRFLKLCLLNIVEFCKGGSQMGGKFFWYFFCQLLFMQTMTQNFLVRHCLYDVKTRRRHFSFILRTLVWSPRIQLCGNSPVFSILNE